MAGRLRSGVGRQRWVILSLRVLGRAWARRLDRLSCMRDDATLSPSTIFPVTFAPSLARMTGCRTADLYSVWSGSRSSDITPWTFSSKRQDPTGFVYFGQRYYEPQTATWLTQDPLGTSAGPNLYAYVNNNPLTCFDLYGLFGESCGGWFSDAIDTVCSAFGSVAGLRL